MDRQTKGRNVVHRAANTALRERLVHPPAERGNVITPSSKEEVLFIEVLRSI